MSHKPRPQRVTVVIGVSQSCVGLTTDYGCCGATGLNMALPWRSRASSGLDSVGVLIGVCGCQGNRVACTFLQTKKNRTLEERSDFRKGVTEIYIASKIIDAM